jgi:hypothetical protein
VGTTCDTADTGTSDTATDTAGTDTGDSAALCDTAPVIVFVDEEDPEVYAGGWECGAVDGKGAGAVLAGAAFALAFSRRRQRT